MGGDPYFSAARVAVELCPALLGYFELTQLRIYINDFVVGFDAMNKDLYDAADLLMSGLLFDIGSRSPAGFHIPYDDLQRATLAALRQIYEAPVSSRRETAAIKI